VTSKIDDFVDCCRTRTEFLLTGCLPATDWNPRLGDAVRYAALGGGKRIRPALVYAGAAAVGDGKFDATDRVACAIELIHTYSLIHDDLPCMDDDDMRRGKPACHIAFDQATAVLAGDGLQTLAFEQLSQIEDAPPATVISLVKLLARASGLGGMILGQAMDLDATNKVVDLNYLETMHQRKTADLITASVMMGAVSTGYSDAEGLRSLSEYGSNIGLAFQVKDDILDDCCDSETLGKQAGADARLDKSTYLSLLGLGQSNSVLGDLVQRSLTAISGLDDRANYLRDLAGYIVNRDY
jgi:geranylgeranyl pyrophosphate synthase